MWIRYQWSFKNFVFGLGLFQFWTGAYILMVAAFFVMFMAIIGCCGAITENPLLLLVVTLTNNEWVYEISICLWLVRLCADNLLRGGVERPYLHFNEWNALEQRHMVAQGKIPYFDLHFWFRPEGSSYSSHCPRKCAFISYSKSTIKLETKSGRISCRKLTVKYDRT